MADMDEMSKPNLRMSDRVSQYKFLTEDLQHATYSGDHRHEIRVVNLREVHHL